MNSPLRLLSFVTITGLMGSACVESAESAGPLLGPGDNWTLVQQTGPEGTVQTWNYDSANRLVSTDLREPCRCVEPPRVKSTYLYEVGRFESEFDTGADGTIDGTRLLTSNEEGLWSRSEWSNNADGGSARYYYDDDNNLVSIEEDGNITRVVRNEAGNIITRFYNGETSSVFAYDTKERIIRRESLLTNNTSTHEYNEDGLLVKTRSWRIGNFDSTTVYGYKEGQLVSKQSWNTETPSVVSVSYQHGYDQSGRLVWSKDNHFDTGITEQRYFSYDRLGRPTLMKRFYNGELLEQIHRSYVEISPNTLEVTVTNGDGELIGLNLLNRFGTARVLPPELPSLNVDLVWSGPDTEAAYSLAD